MGILKRKAVTKTTISGQTKVTARATNIVGRASRARRENKDGISALTTCVVNSVLRSLQNLYRSMRSAQQNVKKKGKKKKKKSPHERFLPCYYPKTHVSSFRADCLPATYKPITSNLAVKE